MNELCWYSKSHFAMIFWILLLFVTATWLLQCAHIMFSNIIWPLLLWPSPGLSTLLDCWTTTYSIHWALARRKKHRQIVKICMLQFLSFVVGVVYFLAVSVIGSCDKNTKPCKLERVRDDFEKEARQAWASHRSLDLRPRKLKDVSFGLCHLLFRFWT